MTQSQPQVIYCDNHLLVLRKPVGMPSQADKSGRLDLLTWGKQYIKHTFQKPGEAWLGLVHRLDQPVGGIVVFGRNSKAASRLSEAIRQHKIKKTYVAVCHNTPVDATWSDYWSVKQNQVVIATTGEKHVSLSFATLGQTHFETGELKLVKIDLHTGRKHQIRAQFAYHDASLVGDRRYGINCNLDLRSPAVALFATTLQFEHPVSHEWLKFHCLPDQVLPFSLEPFWTLLENS